MLRCVAVTVGLLAALPAAAAGEMTADEARQFVIGKTFNYACFDGTRGQGRVNSDGSVSGSVQFQGSGPMRYAQLPANTLLVRGEYACDSLPGLPLQPCLPRIDFGIGLCLLRVYPTARTNDPGP